MDETKIGSQEHEAGRNFLEVREGAAYGPDRAKRMQVGDYIEMPAERFSNWAGKVLEGDTKSLNEGQAKVVLLEIKPEEQIVVEANGVKKEVHASLFYNFGMHFVG